MRGVGGRFVSSVRSFARQAESFHQRMDAYQTDPFDELDREPRATFHGLF
jgi:hypothetical protein